MEKRFKLRAEGEFDIHRFISVANKDLDNLKITMFHIEKIGLPDMTFEFNSKLNALELLDILDRIPDSHVMMETLNLAEKYNGERVCVVL